MQVLHFDTCFVNWLCFSSRHIVRELQSIFLHSDGPKFIFGMNMSRKPMHNSKICINLTFNDVIRFASICSINFVDHKIANA